MADVDGASFEEIATELGFSVAGAKQAVDKALEKAQFIAATDSDEMEIIVLTTMSDYIKMLAKTGELSSADVTLLKDHPAIVRELDGFRDYLHNSIRRARKATAVVNPLGEAKMPRLKSWGCCGRV
jgi:benzoyl-CoA reductase/2-hydroxyglutaryl-CoA dehydratase subunit BcrC/BadD/HgdB